MKKTASMNWLNALHATVNQGQACVLVTITDVEGSSPREVGSRMLVSVDDVSDTIGGGALEFQAIEHSRTLLRLASAKPVIESTQVVLGSDLSQCCGGKVSLNYEYHPACTFNLVVFGAGHVAQSIATIVQQLPCRAQFIDSRAEWLEKLPETSNGYEKLSTSLLGDNPFLAVERCPDNAYFLVMTHSHELDYDLVEAILSRGDSAYCGLIASKSKAVRFKTRLRSKGFTDIELSKLTAPIGKQEHVGKLPMEIAIATVSEILTLHRELQQQRSAGRPLPIPGSTLSNN